MRKVALGVTVFALMVLIVSPVFACEPPPPEPGYSPGFWKHEVRAYVEGKGRLHHTMAEMESFESYIITYIDSGFTLSWANMAFWDKSMKSMWLTVANWFNEAAGLAPYTD
ncbi:MAG: hypothetical protein OEY24_07005 [Candidatus Bathyarchaeota archaeon]|nr:hypothetical protein [Candidatus Bathyarchaeota archaeon]